MRFKLDREV